MNVGIIYNKKSEISGKSHTLSFCNLGNNEGCGIKRCFGERIESDSFSNFE